jgi:hypothetical protein
MSHNIEYNTEQEELKISEYGRNVQEYIKIICDMPDKDKRLELATALVKIIAYMNPELRAQEDYEQIIWDHLHIISDFKLDIDSPFPIPEKGSISYKPDAIGYSTNRIRFRFYGRNLQLMVDKAAEMEDGEDKTNFINVIASFMFNSSRNWNNENLTEIVLAEHLGILSKGKLDIDPEKLEISVEKIRSFTKRPSKQKKSKSNKQRYSRNR